MLTFLISKREFYGISRNYKNNAKSCLVFVFRMGLSDDDYVCSLSPDTEKFAREDLREDEATRKHGIEAMREWINKNPDITNCRTGKLSRLWEFRYFYLNPRQNKN